MMLNRRFLDAQLESRRLVVRIQKTLLFSNVFDMFFGSAKCWGAVLSEPMSGENRYLVEWRPVGFVKSPVELEKWRMWNWCF